MHNTSANTNPSMDATDWANRFVPLPPTEFPPESGDFGRNPDQANSVRASAAPKSQPNLPCLQAIAGADPFFTPADTSSPTPVAAVAANSPSFSSPEPIASVASSENPEKESDNVLQGPSVEIIGQQIEKTTATNEKDQAAETTLHEEKTEANLMKNPSNEKPVVEIHENDLPQNISPDVDVSVAAQVASESVEVVINRSSSDEDPVNDIASYWSQDNVSCFVPGVTPIEAYPVCQEYVEQISVCSEIRMSALSDVQQNQANQPLSADPMETASAGVEEGAQTKAAEQPAAMEEAANTTALVTPEPTQVDPFENDQFESVQHVTPAKSGNQTLQMASAPSPAVVTQNQVDPTQDGDSAESKSEDSKSLDSLNQEGPSETGQGNAFETPAKPVGMESFALPAEPQTEPVLEVPEPDSAPQDVTQTIPQLPVTEIASTPASPHQLFDSVEKSLSDLEAINQLETQDDFSPATNAISDSPVQQQPVIEAEFPLTAGESVRVEEPASIESEAFGGSPSLTSEPLRTPQTHSGNETEAAGVANPAVNVSAAIENPKPSELPASLVESALASITPPVQPAPAFKPVDLTAQLPALPAGTFSAPPETPSPAPVEIQAPVEAPVSASTPIPAETSVEKPQFAPAIPPEGARQAPPETTPAPATAPANVQGQAAAAVPPEAAVAAAPKSNVQVIEVNGNDGYDFLDLKAFDVANAIFTAGVIFLDDGTNRFQIEYRNLSLAVFADDFQVELT